MSRDKLIDLAERCEKATGANKVLDEAIFEALAIVPSREHSFVYPYYAYTASLDAAVTLVPKGWSKWIYDADDGRCICRIEREDESLPELEVGSNALTWPLAICTAALRARSKSTPDILRSDD